LSEDGEKRLGRSDFRHFRAVPTRWEDSDAYGHVNNVVYYSYFDTAVTAHLCESGVLDYRNQPIYGIVVETQCRYMKELTFPEVVDVGIRVTRLGRSSASYEVAIFKAGEDSPAAVGRFTHVYVNRGDHRPVPIPDAVRAVLTPLVADV